MESDSYRKKSKKSKKKYKSRRPIGDPLAVDDLDYNSSSSTNDRDAYSIIENDTDDEIDCPATAKKLYEGPRDEDGFKTWLDNPSEDIANNANKANQQKAHAILIRYPRSIDASGEKIYRLGSLVIQSPVLKKAVRKILKKCPGSGAYSKHPTFKPPFKPFFYHWKELEEFIGNCKPEDAVLPHIQLLQSILAVELQPIQDEFESLTKHGVITYDLLWTIFPAGTVAFGRRSEKDHAFVVKKTENSQLHHISDSQFEAQVECIDWDGFAYGYSMDWFFIEQFSGEKKIAELELVPEDYQVDRDQKMGRLRERGERFEKIINDGGCKAYSGLTQSLRERKKFIEGRIVIDGTGHHYGAPISPGVLRPLTAEIDNDPIQASGPVYDDFGMEIRPRSRSPPRASVYPVRPMPPPPPGNPYAFPSFPPRQMTPPLPDPLGHLGLPNNGLLDDPFAHIFPKQSVPALTAEQLPFCRSVVRGFCLTTKKWAEFDIDGIADVKWNNEAFSKLVMSPARKRLIRALVKGQSATQNQFDDVIEGKGQGLVALLSGPPGTGKTLTAESIAEALKLPLYVLSASELGDDLFQIESTLRNVFQLAAKWNAVLLLDEADAFLEKRSEDLSVEHRERNKRVAAFLRLLEYYKGTLILTTNRPITFDEAFYSRIHLSLHFEPLNSDCRRTIWDNFINSTTIVATGRDLDSLSHIDMNGREIKNVVKMANLLATTEDELMNMDHIKNVIEVIGSTAGSSFKSRK